MNKSALEKLNQKMVFSIEGNIGAGKTTVLSMISKYSSDILFVEEPVSEWQNINGDNLLQKSYENPERYWYSFEAYVLISKMNALIKAAESDKKIIIIERSMFADKVFLDLSAKMGRVNELEHEMFNSVFNFLLKNLYPKLSGFIYLNTPVSLCLERIGVRNRNEENKIQENYLENLNRMFLDMINTSNIPTLVVDGDFHIERDAGLLNEEIGKFIGISKNAKEQSCDN